MLWIATCTQFGPRNGFWWGRGAVTDDHGSSHRHQQHAAKRSFQNILTPTHRRHTFAVTLHKNISRLVSAPPGVHHLRLCVHLVPNRPYMAGPNNLLLSFPEARLLHIASIILLVERSDAVRRAHTWQCWYSRALLLANAPAAFLLAYGLYRQYRP